MDYAELIEEIRSLLRESQSLVVDKPWEYTEADLVPQMRSALRYLRTIGVAVSATLSSQGGLSGALSESHGLLVAYRVAAQLLQGDLTQKMLSGEMGLYYRAGPDIVDTRALSPEAFGKVAAGYEKQFGKLLLAVLAQSNQDQALGDPTAW